MRLPRVAQRCTVADAFRGRFINPQRDEQGECNRDERLPAIKPEAIGIDAESEFSNVSRCAGRVVIGRWLSCWATYSRPGGHNRERF